MLGSSKVMGFLATTDLAAARKFYEGTLGLRVIGEEPSTLVLEAAGTLLRVSRLEKLTPAPYTVLGWVVEQMEQAVSGLAERGVQCERFAGFDQDARGIWTAPDGTKVAWFKDPSGNILSLTQFHGNPLSRARP